MYFIGNITREVFRSKDSDYAVVVFQTSEDGPDPGAQKVIFGAILKEFTKRVISAAGRARIVATTKKRWAAWRKAHKA